MLLCTTCNTHAFLTTQPETGNSEESPGGGLWTLDFASRSASYGFLFKFFTIVLVFLSSKGYWFTGVVFRLISPQANKNQPFGWRTPTPCYFLLHRTTLVPQGSYLLLCTPPYYPPSAQCYSVLHSSTLHCYTLRATHMCSLLHNQILGVQRRLPWRGILESSFRHPLGELWFSIQILYDRASFPIFQRVLV